MTLKTWQRLVRNRRPVHTMQQHTLQVCDNMLSLLDRFHETTALCICTLYTFPATRHRRAEHVFLIMTCMSYISQTHISFRHTSVSDSTETTCVAGEADLVFCPYSYLVDPVIRSAMNIALEGSVLIFDEAHNIEDVSRSATLPKPHLHCQDS